MNKCELEKQAESRRLDASPYIIKCNDVTKVYGEGEARTWAITSVSLEIADAEFVSITGPSGSGKSTLLNMIGALDQPTSGEVLLFGRKTSLLSPEELADIRRDNVGFVFQNFGLMNHLSAFRNVEIPLVLAGIPPKERKSRVGELLGSVGLSDKADRVITKLSGGEKQRVAVARALANKPCLLVADEPTGNLDRATGMSVIDLIIKVKEERNMTFVLVTHDETIAELADRQIQIVDGKVIGS